MDANRLLQWQYLIYLLPGSVSALLLLLSSLRMGHKGGHRGHGHSSGHTSGHAGARGNTGHATAHSSSATANHHSAATSHHPTAIHHGPKVQAKLGKVEVSRHGANRENITVSTNLLLHITGADRAPAMMLAEAFFLVWGVCGYWANEFTVQAAHPDIRQMLPSFGIALVCGIVGARLAAEIIARVMPQDESQDVSRDGLFGMTGTVVFPVSATSGRIHIYDTHGTLHDEMCRLASEQEAIVKGRTAMIVDVDPQGHLLVEEVIN